MTTETITIRGGFHAASAIKIRAEVTEDFMGRHALVNDSQDRRINRHLCGITGCCCGGRGAEVTDKQGTPIELMHVADCE